MRARFEWKRNTSTRKQNNNKISNISHCEVAKNVDLVYWCLISECWTWRCDYGIISYTHYISKAMSATHHTQHYKCERFPIWNKSDFHIWARHEIRASHKPYFVFERKYRLPSYWTCRRQKTCIYIAISSYVVQVSTYNIIVPFRWHFQRTDAQW